MKFLEKLLVTANEYNTHTTTVWKMKCNPLTFSCIDICNSHENYSFVYVTLSQMEIYPASKETIVKPGILTKTFWVFKM